MKSIDELLDMPMYLLDFESQFSDLLDFVEFSENNLEWQRRSHIQSLDREAKKHNYESATYYGELQGIEYRFNVILPRKIRYSSVVAFATSVEWVALFLNTHKTGDLRKKENRVNESIHILREMACQVDSLSNNKLSGKIKKLEDIIKIRNCIAHGGGIVVGYKYQDDIENIINKTHGFSISNEYFVDNAIEISSGTLEIIIKETQDWLVEFVEECRKNGLIELKNA